MGIRVTTQPAVEPVTLQEAKDQIRSDNDDEDSLVSEWILSARHHVESVTSRPLITQSQTKYIDCFEQVIELTPNLQSVTTIKYIDVDGIQQTLNATEYSASITDVVGSVFEAYNKTWPSIRAVKNAVEIEFVCGYGFPADVPPPIKQAIKLLVTHQDENRGATTVGVNITETPMAVDMLLNSYRVVSF
jgi:uncharacterized phiE125 gp8 family phage protein